MLPDDGSIVDSHAGNGQFGLTRASTPPLNPPPSKPVKPNPVTTDLHEGRLGRDYSLYPAICAVAASVAALCIVVWGLGHGIDLTDEGFYLNSISLPYLYGATYSQFGFILHPIYVLVGGDLVLFRLAGLVPLMLAAILFVSTVLRVPLIPPALPKTARLVLVVSGSCAVLLAYSQWIPTPNYNLLNLFGALLIFTGWLRILEDAVSPALQRTGAIVVFALGFMVVALVKPTTAAILAIGLTGLTLPFGRRSLMEVIFAGSLSFLLFVLVLLAIDGDISAVILRYRNALVYNDLFQAGHDVNHFSTLGVETLIGVFVAYLLGRRLNYARFADPRYIAVLIALCFAPIAVAFGTNAGILRSAPRAGIFWVVALALVVMTAAPPNIRWRWLYLAMTMCACGVLILLVHAIQKPYRMNGPLWQQTEWISSATQQHATRVDPATADYFRILQSGAKSAGFQAGTPVIDLTGTAPTTIYMLGGEAVGLAWINGGYPGTDSLAFHALSTVPGAVLRRSWILTSPAGHAHVPSDILAGLGLKFPDDYEEVARAQTGYLSEEQILWRPRSAKTP